MNTGLQILMRLFERRARPKVVAPPPRVDLTLTQWRERLDLVSDAARLHADPNFRLQLEVLLNESPVNYHNLAQPAERTLGQIEGYNMALNNLVALASPAIGETPLEATFEAPKPELK